ncbi:hypothetical protein Celaphus_00009528 [Cervus elaphus hippelaphus]|uniref:Fibrous sheath-interacting protein 2 C-terminal domain-containing protein n=1 Tax=Cervus elaphus hippelaphus TaxID=46360 RepID=A0A212C0I9_CEREH|nr:hypothetical protein Celaphus_00009528 [Cervus elaphus hippelaphus]
MATPSKEGDHKESCNLDQAKSISESCCSTCCETSLYQTSKMVQAGPCTEAADRSIEQRVAPSESSFARKERTDVETTYHRKEHLENKPKAPKPNAPKPKYNEVSESPNLKPCKSDSHLVVRIETGTRKCKDATTETDGLECPLSSDEKAKAISEMQELNNVFINFHHHLKEEVELILGNIFQEMVSELTQTIPTLPSVTTEALPAQTDTDKEDLLSNVDISSAAAEIMENVFEKLQSAVKKTCTEEFSPENVSVHFKSNLVSGEHCISPKEKTSEVSLPYALENMNDVAEDMVRVILEKLTVLASSKQSELAHLKISTDPAYQQHREDPTYTFLQRASKRKSSAKTDAASLIGKEEIQNLVSNICSQSSLVGYIKEAISTILGYIQVGLNNERLVATKETVVILQLLDALLAQLHQKPVKTDVRKSRHSRMSSPSGTEERNRLTSTGVASAPRCRSPFPPINVPGMVLYSEDEKEEIDRIVENVLISSTKDEKAKLQEQVPDYWLTGANADFKRKRNMNLPTKPAYRRKVAFHDQGLNTDLPTFNKDPLKDKPGLNKDILPFSQDETYQIQKASEDIIRSILAEILKDLSSGPSDHSDYEDGREASLLTSRKPQDPSHQEWMDQMFSVSEIHTVSQDVVDDILKILHITSCHIIGHSSSVHQTSLNNADVPNKESLQIWFDSKRKMKFLSALSVDPTKLPWVESGTSGSTSESVDNLIDKIINTVFKKLNSFICPKLQTCFKPESHATHSKPAPDKKSSFRSHLSTFTTKVVKIVLDAIHKELRHNKKNLNVRKNSPPKNFRDTGFFADAENELDSVVTKLNNDIMTSSLATCICEVLSGNTDKSNILVPSDKLRSKISHGTDGIDQQKLLPSHCPCMQEEVHQCTRFQVLDRIGDALYDMLCKLTGDHPHSPLSDEQNTEGINKNLRTTSTLRSSIKLISHTILEGIVSKLCGVDTHGIFKNSEFKAISEHIDTDSLSFALLLEEMSRCYDVISSIASSVTWPGNQEVTNKGKTTAPKIVTTKEKHLNKLKTLASDIFEMVFATLEGFANRNLENLGGNKKNKTYCESENTNICGNTHEKRLQSTLYRHAKKVSSTILKALQTEINMNLPDLDTCISKPLQEKQILKSLVNFILEAISPDMFNEPEPEERGIKNYRYRPIYGNFLPGGADPDSYLEDPADTEKESAGEERPTEDETKSDSLKQQELEKTLKTFEVELKEPKKSPLVPIVRSILNEIFQNDLIGQLKAFTLPQSHLCDTPHADDEPFAQTSVESLDKTVGPLVSEADVTIVADDVIRTIFQKLYSAAMTDRNESENRYNTITFPADISFPKHTRGGKSPVCSTILDRNPCTLQSTFNIGKLTKINLVEDIIQSILTNLEAFATSKVKALFCPHISFTVPMALPSQQDEIALQQPWLSTKDSYSEDQFSCCSMDHSKSGKTTSICQLSASKLNMYATEVARQILQGIKHKLDQDLRSPFLTHSVVAFESIPSQVVSTVLDIVSTKGKYEKNVFDRETDPVAPEDIIEKLFNKSDYRKKLQFQILDTIEGILIDICEETIDENNLPLAVSTLNCNVSGRHLETNSERDPRHVNKAILKLLVPKECVAMISNDMVDIVLQNLTSAIMVCISSNDSISPILSTEFSDAFSKAEHQQSPSKDSVNGRAERQQPIVTNSVNERAKRKQPPVIDSVNERKRERFPFARKGRDVQLKSALSDDNQTTVLKKQDAKKSTPDPCKENAHFVTKTILNRLKSFATERIDLLLILDPETREKPDVGSEFTNCKQNDSVFLESNQTPLDVTVPKISTAGTILSQEVTNYTLANYRENRRPAIHISQASLKEYADLIANTILTLIKNDIDLEIQKMYTYQNNTSFQENIIARETVNNILKNLCNKISLKASGFYLKQDPDLFTQLAVQNEIVPGQREMEDHTKLSLFSKYSGENQKTPEVENQRRTLEEIFRNGESGQEKTNSLLSVVKEILKKAYQRVWENTERCSPFNELPHFTSDSKIKTSAQKKALQSHISSVANDIVESVYRKIFSVIMTSLYENSETRGEMEASGSDGLLMNPSCFRELKQAEKSSDPPKPVIPQVYPYTGIGSVSSLENTSLQFSPLRLGEHLVQQVLKKITDFALLNLEESSSPKGQSDEILRPCSSKGSPKGSPRASVKTNFKTKSKVTSLAKFGTKPQLRPIGAKAQSKTKLGTREKTLKGSWSKTSVGLPHLLSIGEAKTPSLRAKLPTAELKMYARDIVHNILQTIVNEFEEVRQNRAVVNVNTLLSDQIERASGIVNAVLQGLHAMKNNLANPIKGSHSDDIKLPRGYFSTTSAANPEAHFTLENVSSQLDKLFPKEDIFKQMFDKWQTESSNMENEKDKLLMIAKAVLNEISTKAGELEQSVSLLTLSLLEPCESRHHHFKRAASRVEDSQAQINIFGQEIIKKLFEKLELCFLTQMFTTDSKETLQSKKETAARRKCGSLGTNNLNNVPTYNTKLKDKTLGIAGHQITQEILEGVLNTLESFVDLQFKHVSTYAFSELVRTPIENFFAMQQKPPMKTIFPKLQTRTTFPDESKSSSMISQENIDNALQQLYFFHSELLTYAVNTVTDMLSIIKNKLDKEECHKEPSSTSIFEENIVANQIISTLMDQCTYFYELMIKNHPKENLLQGAKNACTVNCSRFTTGPEMSTSKSKGISCWDDPPQISSLLSYSEEDRKIKDKTSLDVPACVSYSIGDSTKTIEPMEGLKSEFKPSSSRSEAHVFSYFDQAVKGDSSLPEDTVSQISSQKSSDPARAALEHPMSFRETEEGENQRVLHYEPLKPLVNPDEIQTTISPLKICLAAEDIVNTMLTSFGLSNQTSHTTENTETMKPFFISKESLHCLTSEQLKNEKSLLKIWEKRNSYGTEEENKGLVASGEDSVLLEKWKNKYLKLEKTLEEPGVIAFADRELGPHEVHLVARYVTTSVVTHFNNFETRDECPNWDTDSGKTARKMFLSSNNSQSHRIPRNNLGLSPKSAFLLNVVCEKLIRMLLEECTASNFLTNSPFSDEISTERQLFNTLQRIDDYSGLTMDYGLPFEEYDMPDLFENLAEIDQESMLNIISHSLVKSLMEKLSCGIQQPPRSPPVTDKHLTYRTSERPPSFPKGERPELKESKQGKNSVRFMSYDSKPLTGPSNNLRVIHSKMQTPFSKQFSGKFPFLPPLRRPDKKATAFLNIQYPGGMNTGVYSATFLEEIIVDIFLNLTTSVQGKNVNVTEAQLNEMNILDINCVVNEFNTAQVTVLRDVEEKMCFPPVYKETVKNMIYKLLARMFPSPETEIELNEEEVPPDYEFVNAASKLTDDIITEISEHEIRLAKAEEHVENLQLGAIDDLADSICNNIIKKIKFEDEVQKDTYKRGGSFLGRIAGFIMKEIVDHHLQPFLCDEKSFPSDLPRNDDVTELLNPIKEKIQSFPQTSVYSATFLEDVVIDLVRKFYTLPRIAENPKDKEISERSIMGLAIKFANVLIGEFRKSEIKVLTNAEKMFSFPPVDKETVDKVCNSVYDEVTEIYGSKNIQKHDRSNIVIETVAALTKKAISAFKILPLFSGSWSSTLFSFLDVDSIMQRIQHLPYKTFTKINRSLKENPVSSLERSSTLIPLTSELKNKMDTSETDGRAVNGKENFKEKTSMKTGSIQQPICINISSIMKSKVTTIALEAVGGMAKKKKGDEKKKETSTAKDENISKLTSTTTSVKSKDTPGLDLGTAFTKNEIKKKDRMARKDEKGRGDELYQHLSPAMDDTKNKVVLEPGFEICGKKKSDKKKGSSLGKGDRPLELSSLKSKVRNTEIQEKRRDSPAYPATNDKQILHSKHAQNVPVSIYRNVLETSLQGPVDDLNYPSLLGENAAYVTQACGKDFAQPASVNSAKENVPAKEEESEIQRQPRKWDNPQNLLENKPRIFPANFLEDVISEIVNKLIFSSSLDTYDACQNVTNDVNPAELYGMAMKLIDSLLKEFSDAQIKVLNQDQGSKFLPSEDNISSVHKAPLRQNELSVVKRPSKKKVIMDTIPPIHNMAPTTKIPSSYQTPFMAKIPSIDKMLVNKIVHSSICNILQDYRSQDSICEDINFNVEKLAKRLANAVIEEILQYQLNLLLYDEVPDSECLPLESKKVMKKVHKMAQTACKECQTSSPYTIMLPYEFLERIISSLLSKIFSTVANAKTEISEDNLYTELDSLQMKLASTVKTEISKDEDMIIQYVKSLHLNDEEIIQSVVQTIYNNLLPQFGSQESIRKCISSGCKILSEAIVNLVVQEVTGNRLQNYFSGELTPLQCTEIDNTIENILRGVIQTSEVPQPQPSRAYKLPFSIIEEIAVKFLSKLLSMFPKAEREQNNPLNTKMQEISSKILSSFQQYISKSHITVVPQVIESATVSLTDSATIEKVVTSVYSTVLKHCGSHISVYKDLMGKSNVLSDIIGFLMVKEISNSEFHPQEQDETSSSELVLESVKIMEKVAKIIDDLKSKSPTKKEAVLDARFLEETIALFLAKLVKLPSASSKDAENLSKPELNKIASQLTKSVTAEISRKNIIVVANPEEFFLNPESIEMISQMVDSVYNCVLQQSGTHEELYRDMKDTNHIFPKEVASLIIRKVSNCPLEMISSGDPCANLFGDLDIDRIVEKVHEYAIKIVPGLEQKGLDQGLRQEELSVRIIPHLGKQPINIDPDIVAEHLGVISIKTQSLDKLQTECLVRTGHSIETLRRASISGKNYSTEIPVAGNRKKEKRVSLDQMGRLNVKPLETSSRNSFQSLIKPDITKVELLKDVQSKKDLIIRLITHDISQENLERKEESLASDEDEVVLQEVVKEEEEFPENSLEDQVKEDMKLATSTVAHPKPPISKCSLKKLLSVGKCQPKSSVTIITEGSRAKQMESEQTLMRTVSNTDVTTSECLTDTNSPWEKKTQLSVSEKCNYQ